METFNFLHEDPPKTPSSHYSAGPVPLRTNVRTFPWLCLGTKFKLLKVGIRSF
jgi:hypothetical protein